MSDSVTDSVADSVSTGEAKVAATEKQRMRAKDLMMMAFCLASEFTDSAAGPFYREAFSSKVHLAGEGAARRPGLESCPLVMITEL